MQDTYRVGDDQDVGVGGSVSSSLSEVADDGGVGVEEVYTSQVVSFPEISGLERTVTGHAGLTGNTGGDEDDLRVLEGIAEARGRGGVVASDGAVSVDVTEVSSDTRSTADIVERELGNAGVELQEEGEGLANATTSTEDGDLGGLYRYIR